VVQFQNMLDIIFNKENGLPHISTTLECEFLNKCAGLSGDKGAQSACARAKMS
jgi:hypothetical protein